MLTMLRGLNPPQHSAVTLPPQLFQIPDSANQLPAIQRLLKAPSVVDDDIPSPGCGQLH